MKEMLGENDAMMHSHAGDCLFCLGVNVGMVRRRERAGLERAGLEYFDLEWRTAIEGRTGRHNSNSG